jgi:hypothetical protein
VIESTSRQISLWKKKYLLSWHSLYVFVFVLSNIYIGEHKFICSLFFFNFSC